MLRSLIAAFCLAGSCLLLQAQSPLRITSSSDNATTIEFVPGAMKRLPYLDDAALAVTCGGCKPHLQKGMPDLGQLTASLLLPPGSSPQIAIIEAEFTEFPFGRLLPSKGNLSRIVDPSRIPFEESEVYAQNDWWPAQIASTGSVYQWHSREGVSIHLIPFQYNPVTQSLRVYSRVKLQVTHVAFTENRNAVALSPEWNAAFSRHFLNYEEGRALYPALTPQAGRMLILSHGPFMPSMAPFVEWKKQKGIAVDLVDVASIGDADAVRNYVAGYYHTFGLDWLLLVGDAAQVPTFYGLYGDSDVQFGLIEGSDFYPEVMVGRFSAETVAEVNTQVQRVLQYEKTPGAGDWFSSAIGIGSNQGPGDDNEYDYQHIRNIRSQLMDYHYTTVHELYDGSQGGEDQAGNPNAQLLFDHIQAGAGLINYTGHGSDFACSTTGFSTAWADELTNTEAFPFFIAVACVNGNFRPYTCLAESFLRATDESGAPAGAIATFMSTINQSWDPPMEAQDEMNAILTENVAEAATHTLGGITTNGCMKMNDTYGAAGFEMTETWTLFGDPSTVLRTRTPEPLLVVHATAIPQWSQQFLVTCPTEGTLVCATLGGEILATAFVSNGHALLSFDALTTTAPLLITATAFNKLPYQQPVDVYAAVGVEPGLPADWLVFPVPMTNELHLQCPVNDRAELLNAQGVVVAQQEVTMGAEVKMEVQHLPAGVYFLRIGSRGRTLTKID